jgi:hypothetical protein
MITFLTHISDFLLGILYYTTLGIPRYEKSLRVQLIFYQVTTNTFLL